MRCRGPNCQREIEFIALPSKDGQGRVMVPFDVPLRQQVVLTDGRKAVGMIYHHTTCPDVEVFRRPARKRGEAHGEGTGETQAPEGRREATQGDARGKARGEVLAQQADQITEG